MYVFVSRFLMYVFSLCLSFFSFFIYLFIFHTALSQHPHIQYSFYRNSSNENVAPGGTPHPHDPPASCTVKVRLYVRLGVMEPPLFNNVYMAEAASLVYYMSSVVYQRLYIYRSTGERGLVKYS